VSKRHQHNRRKAYGRRQHELHERRQRDLVPLTDDALFGDLGPAGIVDRMALIDPRSPRLHYALGD
jgi:hypothetical protein